MTSISEYLRQQVRQRAQHHCEYCLMPDTLVITPHEPDHIIAEKHGGETSLENLAYACFFCNRHKGSDISSIDPVTKKITPLFNPRIHQWKRHFLLNGPRIEPLTAQGRATIQLLRINSDEQIELRRKLMAGGNYP